MSTATEPYVEGPRHAVVTPDDHGAVLSIAAWFLMVTMILTASLRFSVRFLTSHLPGWDDAALLAALIFGVMEVIAVSIAVDLGLGKRAVLLEDREIQFISQALYGAILLYVFTLTLSKASVAILVSRLATVRRHMFAIRATMVLVAAWTVVAVFTVGLRCGSDTPSKTLMTKCGSHTVTWGLLGTIDMAIDAILMVLPTWVVWDLQMTRDKKLTVASAFSAQILPITAQIVRLVYLNKAHDGQDRSFDAVYYATATQAHMSLSLISCSVPALKPFMDAAASGYIGARTNFSSIKDSQPSKSIYAMSSLARRKGSCAQSAGTDTTSARMVDSLNQGCPTKNRTVVLAAKANEYEGNPEAIHRSVEVQIQYEGEEDEARLYPRDRSMEAPSLAVSADTGHQVADEAGDMCRKKGSSVISMA